MNENDLSAIREAVRTAVGEAMSNHCPLTEQERKSVPHLYGLFRDMGDGDIDRGIRKFRAVFQFTGAIYSWRNIVSGAVLLAAILAVFGWLGKVLIAGLVGTIKGL